MERIGVRKSSFNIERGYEDVGVGGGGGGGRGGGGLKV